MQLFPIRHHSPVCAGQLEQALYLHRPRCILVEGPSDATHLIPTLVAGDTHPPVAILAYSPAENGRPPRSALWPFCDYSPEWIAMQASVDLGAEVRFIDAPTAFSLAWLARQQKAATEGRDESTGAPPNPAVEANTRLFESIARHFGFESYDEFWEARFEMAGASDDLPGAIWAFGELVREHPFPDESWVALNAQREAWMRQEIRRAAADGYTPDEILIVCGAAHGPALHADPCPDDDMHLEAIAALEAARLAIIPFSFLRLSEQVGYGAGNRAPAFYQKVWEQGLDFEQAVQLQLIELSHAMRDAGFSVGIADSIAANRLARSLAGMRHKPAPGYYELREAADTCFGRGQPVGKYLEPLLIGTTLGRVSGQVERTSLQEEFYATAAGFGMPLTDKPTEHQLYLTEPADVDASVFLHRLNAADIPFSNLRQTQRPALPVSPSSPGGSLLQRISRGGPPSPVPLPGGRPPGSMGADLLGQLRETWTLQWSPATDIRLLESSVLGSTLEEVCERVYEEHLDKVKNMAQASEVLLRIVLARLKHLYDRALERCEAISAHDDDLYAQARSAQSLHTLLMYGSSRGTDERPISALLSKVFARAALLLPRAAAVSQEATGPVVDSIKALYGVAARSPHVDGALFTRQLTRTLELQEAPPIVHGLCAMLLFLSDHLSEEGLLQQVQRHLSPGVPPRHGAAFVEGLLSLNRIVILRSPAIVRQLDAYLRGMSLEDFVRTLPALRRATSELSRAEIEYLIGTLIDVLNLEHAEARRIAQALSKEELGSLNEALQKRLGGQRRE